MNINFDLSQRLSNYQYSLLVEAERKGISLERMLEISQTTSGSLVRRGFLAWDGEMFALTAAGATIKELFGQSDIGRAGWHRPLSSFIIKKTPMLNKATEGLRQGYKELAAQERAKESGRDRAKEAKVKRAGGR